MHVYGTQTDCTVHPSLEALEEKVTICAESVLMLWNVLTYFMCLHYQFGKKNINRGTSKRGMEEEKGLRDSKLPLILMEAIITGRKSERAILCPTLPISNFSSQGLLALAALTSRTNTLADLHRPHGFDRKLLSLCYLAES